MPLEVSVIISTYNSPKFLKKAIQSVLQQTLSDEKYELLVVYNDSDHASEAVEESMDNSLIRWFTESGGSLSHGRNVGIENATGDIVAFLDDDAVASPEWLESIVHTYNHVKPTPVCVGGPVNPEYESDPPEWFSESISAIGICDYGSQERWLNFPEEFIIGANMSFKSDALLDIGGFPTELGRQQGGLLSNEEIVVQSHLSTDPYYQPNASITHNIEEYRLTLSYLSRRFFWQGISERRTENIRASSANDDTREKYNSTGSRLRLVYNEIIMNFLSLDRPSMVIGFMNLMFGLGYLVESGYQSIKDF